MLALLLALQTAQDPFHVDFAVHSSPSGEWSLTVDPLEPDGGGPALYRMTHGGELAFDEQLAFTLSAVAVTDAGFAVGYGFPHGPLSAGTLHVVSLAPDGTVVLDEQRERRISRVIHGAPVPHPTGLLVHGEQDVFGVQAIPSDEACGEGTLWLYRISTGTKLDGEPPAGMRPPGTSARPAAEPPVAALELERLPSRELDPEHALERASTLDATITRSGRLILIQRRERRVLAWNGGGEWLFETQLADGKPLGHSARVQDGPGGTLLIQTSPLDSFALQIGADGEEREPAAFADRSPTVTAQGVCGRFGVGGVGLRYTPAEGTTPLLLDRRPDRRWLRPDAAVVDVDGSLWVLSEDALCRFTAQGEPSEQIALPGTYGALFVTPAWILCQERWTKATLLVRRSDGELFRHFTSTFGQCAALAPGGDELWWLDPRGPRLDRYRLPERADARKR